MRHPLLCKHRATFYPVGSSKLRVCTSGLPLSSYELLVCVKGATKPLLQRVKRIRSCQQFQEITRCSEGCGMPDVPGLHLPSRCHL